MLSGGAGRNLGLTLLLVGVAAVWGWTFKVVQDAIVAYGVLSFLAIRFAIAAAALSPLSARRMKRGTLLAGVGIGLVLAVGYFFQTVGLKYTRPTNSGLLTGLFIVFVPFFDLSLFGVRIRRFLWLAVGASLVGMVLMSVESSGDLRTGDMLTVVGAAAFGLHISLLGRYSRGHDSGALAMAQMLTVAAVAGVAWPFFEPVRLPPAEVWWALAVTGVLASAVAFYVQTYVQRRLSALRTGIIFTTEPLFAAMFGYLLAGDRLTPLQLAGAILLMCAIATSEIVPAWLKARGPSRRAQPK